MSSLFEVMSNNIDRILNGNRAQECFVFPKPKFPTRPQLKSAIEKEVAYYADKKAEDDKKKAAKAVSDKEKKIAILKEKLAKLENNA